MAETDAEVGSLQAEFAALRHQIAAELGARDVPPPPPAPAPQTTSVAYTGSRPSYDELQPPDAEVMGHFYQLRESLLGGRGASQFCPNPHGDSTVALEMASNTLKIRPSEAGAVPPPPAAEATDDAMTTQYNELRASIAQRLASEAPPPTFAAAPPPAGDTDVNGDYYPVRGAEPAAGVQVVGEDTVVLNAAKPGRPGGAELFTAAPPPSRPADRAAARARQAPPAPTSAVVAAAAPRGIVAGAASERITFGHLAVREAIESHRRHYPTRAPHCARAADAAPVATVSPNGPRLATAERAALREAVVNAAASEAAETEADDGPRHAAQAQGAASAGERRRVPRAAGVGRGAAPPRHRRGAAAVDGGGARGRADGRVGVDRRAPAGGARAPRRPRGADGAGLARRHRPRRPRAGAGAPRDPEPLERDQPRHDRQRGRRVSPADGRRPYWPRKGARARLCACVRSADPLYFDRL